MQSNEEIFQEFFSRGGSLRMLADVPRERLDKVYAYANQLFDKQAYKKAKSFYLLLARLDEWCFNYWLALGICCQRLAEHEEAIFCFSRSGVIVIDDPRSSFYAGMSYEILGNHTYAYKSFRAALNWCGQSAHYEEIRHLSTQALERNQ